MCSSELIYLAISFLLQVTIIMPLHPQVSRGAFAELKGSSAGIGFYLKADLIFCVFLYDVILAYERTYACMCACKPDG